MGGVFCAYAYGLFPSLSPASISLHFVNGAREANGISSGNTYKTILPDIMLQSANNLVQTLAITTEVLASFQVLSILLRNV